MYYRSGIVILTEIHCGIQQGQKELKMENRMRIRVSNEADRIAVASVLIKNGYAVKVLRVRREGKSQTETYLEVWDECSAG